MAGREEQLKMHSPKYTPPVCISASCHSRAVSSIDAEEKLDDFKISFLDSFYKRKVGM